MSVRVAVLVLLALVVLPGLVDARGHTRPLCEGEPLVYVYECYSGVRVSACTNPDVLRGLGCFALL